MKVKRILFLILSALGLILLLLSKFALTSDDLKTIANLCTGLGYGLLVLGIGNSFDTFIASKIESKGIKTGSSIEAHDERNIMIKEKASHMTLRIMNYIFAIFILTAAFMKVHIIFLIIGISLFLIEFLLLLIFSNYYFKKM